MANHPRAGALQYLAGVVPSTGQSKLLYLTGVRLLASSYVTWMKREEWVLAEGRSKHCQVEERKSSNETMNQRSRCSTQLASKPKVKRVTKMSPFCFKHSGPSVRFIDRGASDLYLEGLVDRSLITADLESAFTQTRRP